MGNRWRLAMAVVGGWLRPSLARIVDAEVKRHFGANASARRLRYGPVRRALNVLSERPRLSLLVAAIAYAVASFGGGVDSPAWVPQTPKVDSSDLKTFVLALLGAQAALLGLVYPLVIALIGMLFDARASAGGKLQVFFRETQAVAVGASALALIAAIGLQALFFGALSQNLIAVWSVLDLAWFLANLAGLGFFVARSLDFMRPTPRERLTHSYLANTAWRAELRASLMTEHWLGAVAYGHLPRPPVDEFDVIMPVDLGDGTPAVTRVLRRPSVLSDVRLALLAAVLRHHSGDLSLRPIPSVIYEGEVILADGQESVGGLQSALVRAAFQFQALSPAEPPPTVETMLVDVVGDVMARMAAGSYEEFRTRLREALNLHALAYGLALTSTAGSYATVGQSGSLARDWAGAYRDLFRRAGSNLVEDGRYFEHCAFLPSNLLGRMDRPVAYEAVEPLFFLPVFLMRRLLEGAVRRHVEALPSPPQRGSLFNASGRGRAHYHAAWHSFVGGWESLGDAATRLEDRRHADWPELSAIAPALQRHLMDTATMVALAAKSGEQHAIGWTADIALKWHGKMTQGWPDARGYALYQTLPTLALMKRPWSEVESLSLMRFEERPQPWDVFAAATENVWIDTLVVLESSLIGFFGPTETAGRIEGGPAKAAASIFCNASFDAGASTHPRAAPLHTEAILQAVLRLVGAGARFDEGYGNQIGALAEVIDQLEGPSYISARIYSSSGMADVHGQADPQILLLAASIDLTGRHRGIALGEETQMLLLPDDDAARRDLLQHVQAMRDALKAVVPDRGRAIVATLRNEDCSRAQLTQRLKQVEALLAACETEITRTREAAIRAAVVDPVRLAAVSAAAESRAFSPKANVPLRLFESIEYVDTPLPETTWRWTGISLGQYTAPLMASDSIDKTFWEQSMPQRVSIILLRDVTSLREPDVQRRPRSGEGYWRSLKDAMAAVQAAGQTPVVFRPSATEPGWLWAWHHQGGGSPPRPSDMRLEFRQDPAEEYGFHLNGVPIYECLGVLGATWILGQENFAKAEFHRDGSGRVVRAVLEDGPTDPWRGVMALTFGRRITMAGGPIWQIHHPKS